MEQDFENNKRIFTCHLLANSTNQTNYLLKCVIFNIKQIFLLRVKLLIPFI
jgi:hypothetical protein